MLQTSFLLKGIMMSFVMIALEQWQGKKHFPTYRTLSAALMALMFQYTGPVHVLLMP